MEHDFIDKYSDLNSLVHRLDPRTKIISVLSFVLFVVLTPPEAWITFSLYFLSILLVIYLSKVPYVYVFKRSLVALPFVLLVALFIPFLKPGEVAGGYNFGTFKIAVTYNGLTVLWNVFVKSYLSTLAIASLSSTTKFPDLLKGSEKLKVPRILVLITSFMYRYTFVLADEVMRMKRAYASRSFRNGRVKRARLSLAYQRGRARQAKALGGVVGALFIRTYERAERVYLAMCSRGFDGKIRTLNNFRLTLTDFCYLLSFALYLLLVRVGTAG